MYLSEIVFLIGKKKNQWQLLFPYGSNNLELICVNSIFLRRSKWDPEEHLLTLKILTFCLKAEVLFGSFMEYHEFS